MVLVRYLIVIGIMLQVNISIVLQFTFFGEYVYVFDKTAWLFYKCSGKVL